MFAGRSSPERRAPDGADLAILKNPIPIVTIGVPSNRHERGERTRLAAALHMRHTVVRINPHSPSLISAQIVMGAIRPGVNRACHDAFALRRATFRFVRQIQSGTADRGAKGYSNAWQTGGRAARSIRSERCRSRRQSTLQPDQRALARRLGLRHQPRQQITHRIDAAAAVFGDRAQARPDQKMPGQSIIRSGGTPDRIKMLAKTRASSDQVAHLIG